MTEHRFNSIDELRDAARAFKEKIGERNITETWMTDHPGRPKLPSVDRCLECG